MLARGVVLVDGFSPGFQPPAGQEAEHQRRLAAVVKIDDEDADAKHGLGGYHGSVHVTSDGSDVTVYYAVGVYSEGGNGIPVFDQSWKNVAATPQAHRIARWLTARRHRQQVAPEFRIAACRPCGPG